MDNEITKKFVENTGFICTKCGSVIVDGHKHDNEEDLCDNCRIADLEAKLAKKEEELQIYKLEELADTVADLGMPKVSKHQLWQSIEDQHSRNMVLEKRLEIANEENQQLKQQLAEKEHSIEMLNQHLTDKAIEIERLGEELKELKEYHDKYPYSYSEEYMLNNKELKQQLAKKEKEIENYLKVMANDKQFFMNYAKGCGTLQERQKQMHNQDKIELLEKIDKKVDELVDDYAHFDYSSWCVYINTLIKEIKGE